MPAIRTITPIIAPLFLLVSARVLFPHISEMPPSRQEMISLAPYLIAIAGLLLSIHFRRGRVCLLLIISTVAYYLMSSRLSPGPDTPESLLVFRAMAVILPFNLLLVTLMREKGICGGPGRMRLFFLAAQLFFLWFTIQQGIQNIWIKLTSPMFQWGLIDKLTLPQPALLLLSIAGGISLIRGIVRRSPVEAGIFGTSVAYAVILNNPWNPGLLPVFNIALTMILILSVVQESHNMAFRDDLTGLPSRRALNEELSALGSRYAIAMLDVDHFKRFNDRYGHDVGDQVLKMVAARMMMVTGGGQAFRYGGEEFTVVFKGKTSKDVAPHLEKLRISIADYRMNIRGDGRPKDGKNAENQRQAGRQSDEVSVTISIGVAESTPVAATPAAVIKAADQALYKAKNGGRNQVCLASNR